MTVLIGTLVGIVLLRQHDAKRSKERIDADRYEREVQASSPEELARRGLKVDARWKGSSIRDIFLREVQVDPRNHVLFMRCSVDPQDIGLIWKAEPGLMPGPAPFVWPSGSGTLASLRSPAWWQGEGEEVWLARPMSEKTSDGWLGRRLIYDRKSRTLLLWNFNRTDWQPATVPQAAPSDTFVRKATAVLAERRFPLSAGGWIIAPGLSPVNLGVGAPVGVESFDLIVLPLPDRWRFVLRLGGLEESVAAAFIRAENMREIAGNAPLPAWQHALPPAQSELLQVGSGRRWQQELSLPGTGERLSGRYAAYDSAAKILVLWDWVDPLPSKPSRSATGATGR
jgi:hypothetical protein